MCSNRQRGGIFELGVDEPQSSTQSRFGGHVVSANDPTKPSRHANGIDRTADVPSKCREQLRQNASRVFLVRDGMALDDRHSTIAPRIGWVLLKHDYLDARTADVDPDQTFVLASHRVQRDPSSDLSCAIDRTCPGASRPNRGN